MWHAVEVFKRYMAARKKVGYTRTPIGISTRLTLRHYLNDVISAAYVIKNCSLELGIY